MANRLNGKCALVTGAASGMGKAIALAYLREGAKIIATDMNEGRLQELVEEAADEGFGEDVLTTLVGNVTKDEDCEAAVNLCVEKYGVMNVLSHNAGIADDFSLVEDIKNEDWDRLIAVNLTGSMKVTRAALRYLAPKAQEEDEFEASIVMITSNAAFESVTGGPAYCASKAGANALMKAIAFEYKRYGIRCNSICPGPVLTNITDSAPVFNEKGSAIHQATGYNAHCYEWTGGIIGFPDEDIAPLAVYLASDESKFMNSSSIVIDSGVCLSR
ncbi:MAG: SDR family oxidoreductase [Firmicutes bacterium]|nr:SDR family oxidoreductase [Bacillota bacterium]MCR4712326.1 SDR family oxidoreductase [Clostridia bacterium]